MSGLQRECSFSSEKSHELTHQQDIFCFDHASAFYTSNNIVKMLMNYKFKAQLQPEILPEITAVVTFAVTCFKHIM